MIVDGTTCELLQKPLWQIGLNANLAELNPSLPTLNDYLRCRPLYSNIPYSAIVEDDSIQAHCFYYEPLMNWDTYGIKLPPGPAARLVSFAVHHSSRMSGYGRTLLEHVLQKLRDRVKHVLVETDRSAEQFYRRCGFRTLFHYEDIHILLYTF